MEKERPLYQLLAESFAARNVCELHEDKEWFGRHTDRIESLIKRFMPSGSGFDSGTQLDFEKSMDERIVFLTAFHHMNANGYYEGWTHHNVIVAPSLAAGFNIRVTGRDRNGIKEYIAETFHGCLSELRSYADVEE